ncbi:LuxR C-terminal-related transcriptional regulator [Paenibacillus whitsoniae]|uniref:LuxR family transcriptional regulator n=1 Tax=Paenibacillus whitsoniae TaxID=2496558 RepID=A0A430JBS0_9BACL|nr:LuxR C-terminal-related transcriptional regulator [Paenibacillus whitsoniae]RTE08468.1 LuxR family transcriptional regulator [Paenibacillus whitsoniae]
MISQPAPILLKAKTTYPALKETLVKRGRLLTAITAGLQGRLTLVCAPAGFGKTTLLSQWAHSQPQAPAWLSLDELDNDLVRFWRYVVHALTAIVPETAAQRIASLIEALPNVSISTFLDALLNEMYVLPETAVLILDDYQRIRNEHIHSSLSYFIDYLPQQLHVLIASRNELPFPTVHWLAREEYSCIDVSQLQFTSQETTLFFQAMSSPGLSPDQIEQLTLRTEGWVTALKLILLNLRAGTQVSDYVLGFSGNYRDIADYLFHEVVSKLPADIYQFLLQTASLHRMDAILCHAVTQETNSAQLLEQLKSLNLFLVPLDEQNNWFRYHHLFAQYLQELVQKKHPALWYRANRLASTCLAARGFMEEAIHHAIAAEDFELMQAHLERHLPTVLNKGELSTLLHWFQCMPAETEMSPELALFYAFVLVLTGQLGQAEQELEHIERISTTMEQTERWAQLQSGILFVRSNLVFLNGDFDRWFAFAEGILDRILPANPTYYNFNYNTTEPLVRRTAIGLKGALSRDTETIGNLFMGVLESHGWQESLLNLYVKQSLYEGYYEWNRLEQCRELFPALKRAAMSHQIPGLLIPLCLIEARIHLAEGRSRLAHDVIDETLLACKKLDTHWIDVLRACKVRLYVQDGQISQAKKELAHLGLTVKDKPTFNKEFEFITLCRFLGKQRKETEALRLLEQLWPQSEREQLYSSLVEIAILQALLEAQRGQRSAALQYVHKALVIGEPFGYIRSFLDEGAAMAELLSAYLSSSDTELSSSSGVSEAYVRMLLALFPKVSKPYTTPDPVTAEALTRRESDLLRLIQQGASNKQMAAALSLSEGTVRIYLSRLYEKLGVSSRTQALVAAQDLNLLKNIPLMPD